MTINEQNAVLGKEITTHRTDELAIIRKIVALRNECAAVPAWTGNNARGWRPTRSITFNRGAQQILDEHNIGDLALWYWFCTKAGEQS